MSADDEVDVEVNVNMRTEPNTPRTDDFGAAPGDLTSPVSIMSPEAGPDEGSARPGSEMGHETLPDEAPPGGGEDEFQLSEKEMRSLTVVHAFLSKALFRARMARNKKGPPILKVVAPAQAFVEAGAEARARGTTTPAAGHAEAAVAPPPTAPPGVPAPAVHVVPEAAVAAPAPVVAAVAAAPAVAAVPVVADVAAVAAAPIHVAPVAAAPVAPVGVAAPSAVPADAAPAPAAPIPAVVAAAVAAVAAMAGLEAPVLPAAAGVAGGEAAAPAPAHEAAPAAPVTAPTDAALAPAAEVAPVVAPEVAPVAALVAAPGVAVAHRPVTHPLCTCGVRVVVGDHAPWLGALSWSPEAGPLLTAKAVLDWAGGGF